ncbi:MAG: hypothetical protein U5J64_05930 [Halobacteriales archaeon]|nr:hypothetical protein [Halobacteriales archaeon]
MVLTAATASTATSRDWENGNPDPLGLLVFGALAVYGVLRLTGWTGFAHSPVFAALVLSVGAGFVAVLCTPYPELSAKPTRIRTLNYTVSSSVF